MKGTLRKRCAAPSGLRHVATERSRTIHRPTLIEADEASLPGADLTFLHIPNDFPMPDLEDQLVWSASLGLDLADRPVLEAEVLIWRIVEQKSTTLMWHL